MRSHLLLVILAWLALQCGCGKPHKSNNHNKVALKPVADCIRQLDTSTSAAELIDACDNLAASGAEAKAAVPKLTDLAVDLQDLPPEVASAAANALVSIDPEEAKVAQAKAQSVANLRRLGYVLHLYDSSNGMLPSRRTDPFKTTCWRTQLTELLSKQATPEVSDELAKKHGKARANVLLGPTEKTTSGMPITFASPLGDTQPNKTYIQCCLCKLAPLDFPGAISPSQISHLTGTRNTLLLVEAGRPVTWDRAEDLACDGIDELIKIGGPYKDVIYALAADNHIEKISRSPTPTERVALCKLTLTVAQNPQK